MRERDKSYSQTEQFYSPRRRGRDRRSDGDEPASNFRSPTKFFVIVGERKGAIVIRKRRSHTFSPSDLAQVDGLMKMNGSGNKRRKHNKSF